MILENKTVLIMGIRNKWSIAWGAAQSAYENGAKVLFTFNGEENRAKVEELISEIPGSKAYECGVDTDEQIKKALETIKNENGKIDVDKMEIITFDMVSNTYRVLGDVVGNAFKDGMKLK